MHTMTKLKVNVLHRFSKEGFTLVELLVVISVISLLMAILLPALQRSKTQAKKIKCANNLKQIYIGLNLFASENDGMLPLNASGWWLWDIAYSTTNCIIRTGAEKTCFYCPAETSKNCKMAIVWQFTQLITPPGFPCNTESGVIAEPTTDLDEFYRVTGYFWLMDTKIGRPTKPLGTPKKDWVKRVDQKNASETELVTDATLSTTVDANTASFDQVPGGLFAMCQLYDRTNHLKKRRPEGGNILFLDGHTAWRPFSEMQRRYGGSPSFWW
jgi:prepilin-type N-terminal cleavage/methylation domain-containing protein/prepilin-type processing-associated H-X9-DG protein